MLAVACKQIVDDRSDDETKDHRDSKSADYSDGEWLKHLRACAEREGQGKHSANCCDRSHQDGAKTALGGVEHASRGICTFCAGLFVGVEK